MENKTKALSICTLFNSVNISGERLYKVINLITIEERVTLLLNLGARVHLTPKEFESEFSLKKHINFFCPHFTPKEFENRGFTLKTHQFFFVLAHYDGGI